MVYPSQRVLVVDKEAWWRDLIHKLLTVRGIEVNCLDELDQGLTEVGKGGYDIVLISDRVLDYPILESRLQGVLESKPSQQIVLVSAAPDWQKARESFLLGAADHITKSIEAGEVLSSLAHHLKYSAEVDVTGANGLCGGRDDPSKPG